MWYTECGKESDVVLSSRVRLARNIEGIPFPERATAEEQDKVIEICKTAVFDSDIKLNYIDIGAMKDYEKQAIAECHIISPQMMDNSIKRGLLLSDDSSVSVLVNEEDHLRIQCMSAGLELDKCFEMANRIDDSLEQTADFAFDSQFGYLTCCPTNVGTGMRASVMVHLPALTISGGINSVIDSLSQLGMTVRGIFGEGSKATGDIYQISNQTTLGESEENILERFEQIITEVIGKERELRTTIYNADKYHIEDKLMRSFGILTNAVILSSAEAMTRLSDVRFATELGIIKDMSLQKLNTAIYAVLPANIVKNYNLTDPTERDLKRAEIIKEILL
ncbi:MAG: protein arginine kinase [Clostridia bacterium]|nr:protein arginine kinase [Clostridia bacterium]